MALDFREYARENGWFLLAERVLGAGLRRTRDALIARKLGTSGLRLGKNPKLAGLAHMHIGRDLSAGNGLWLEAVTAFAGMTYDPILTIGDGVNLSDEVHIACTHRVSVGDGVLTGSRIIITDHAHGQYTGPRQSSPLLRPVERILSNDRTVSIGRNVWLGDGVAVLPGAEIGEGTVVGTNSVVTGTLPPFCIAVGTPARPIRRWNAAVTQWMPWEG